MEIRKLLKLIEAFSETYSGQVYHYTSADGVAGIIANHEIWMSNTEFTNDTTELKMLSKNHDLFSDNDFKNDFVKKAWKDKIIRYEIDKDSSSSYFYMASFSKCKDSLEQWRAYGNYCIGFDASQLGNKKKRVVLYSCLYTEKDIRQWILRNEKKSGWGKLTDEQTSEAAAFFLLSVADMKETKNKHFKSEEEVRLITTSSHYWSFDNSPEMYEDDLPIHCRRHPPLMDFLFLSLNFLSSRIIKAAKQERKKRKWR